ncbi:hypothetical protein MKY29_11895 [Psychrobacillus sp. FSL K6-2365]|uniref:hypothetical protein n=1 Tax=Psychrobacillus sp. FSL K6-2365 TaxID=2921546 RepID=UPI0030F61F39
MYPVRRYFVPIDEGNFMVDVWKMAGGYRASAQQLDVDEYRTRITKSQNTETIAVHTAVNMLIKDYNL